MYWYQSLIKKQTLQVSGILQLTRWHCCTRVYFSVYQWLRRVQQWRYLHTKRLSQGLFLQRRNLHWCVDACQSSCLYSMNWGECFFMLNNNVDCYCSMRNWLCHMRFDQLMSIIRLWRRLCLHRHVHIVPRLVLTPAFSLLPVKLKIIQNLRMWPFQNILSIQENT
jgi:hypothetical protein